MDQGNIIDIMQHALWTVILSSAPPLLLGLIVGLVVSIFQTVTSIQEQTLSFVPKILAVFVSLMIFGPFMLSILSQFMINLYSDFSKFLR